MKLLITAADSLVGGLLCQRLATGHEVAPVGFSAEVDMAHYRRMDLLQQDLVEEQLQDIDTIVHALPYVAALGEGDQREQELLDTVARATYVLVTAACNAKVRRLVLISRLDLFRTYDERFIITTEWQPQPEANAESLAPYMAELVGREVARTGKIEVIALRFGKLGVETTEDEAVAAVEQALDEELRGSYHWSVKHIASSGRFVR
ncbi:MAG: NAD-dependent epimerase/dehydratase family protein [Candidatus Latescibacterota bacterium]|jgi:nucleoside-diphosphate-sugar epimerase